MALLGLQLRHQKCLVLTPKVFSGIHILSSFSSVQDSKRQSFLSPPDRLATDVKHEIIAEQ